MKAYLVGPYAFLPHPQGQRGHWCKTDRCVMFVKCTSCEAVVGELCRNQDGSASTDTHYPRRELYTSVGGMRQHSSTGYVDLEVLKEPGYTPRQREVVAALAKILTERMPERRPMDATVKELAQAASIPRSSTRSVLKSLQVRDIVSSSVFSDQVRYWQLTGEGWQLAYSFAEKR